MQFDNHDNYNCHITVDNGQQYSIYANWMHNNGLDTWQGWHCDAGSTRFYIDKNLEVWSGECRNDHLGSALDADLSRLRQGTICQQDRCTGCTLDLLVTKYRRTT